MGIGDEIPKVGTDLVEIDKKTGFLKVNFSEKLFQLIQDSRLLTEYGYQKLGKKEKNEKNKKFEFKGDIIDEKAEEEENGGNNMDNEEVIENGSEKFKINKTKEEDKKENEVN